MKVIHTERATWGAFQVVELADGKYAVEQVFDDPDAEGVTHQTFADPELAIEQARTLARWA